MYIKRITLLAISLLVTTIMLFSQNKNVLEEIVKVKRTNGTISEFLEDIEKIPGVNLSYNNSIVPDKKVSLDKEEWKLDNLLKEILRNTGIVFQYRAGQVLLKKGKFPKISISGTLKGKTDGEYLIGATIYAVETNVGTITNSYGFYSISLEPGEYTLMFSYLGYTNLLQNVSLTKNLKLNLELEPQMVELAEVVVKGSRNTQNLKAPRMSMHAVKIDRIKATPMIAGEADVLKSVQFLPGIQSAIEGTTGFSVRGGSYDQNLILLDEAPVYNPSHSMGLFSTFNVDAIRDVKVYKGAIPAKYGGRLSSVIDIRMKEGNDKKFAVNGGVGIAGSRLTLEGPVGKNVSYLVSGRYSYIGYTANQMANLLSDIAPDVKSFGTGNEISFYDLNAKVNVKLNPNNRIYFSAYTGNDHFYNNILFEDNTLDWGNLTGTFRWNHVFNPKLFGNLTLIYSNYNYAYIVNNDARDFKWSANFKQKGAKMDFDFFASPKSKFNFGIKLTDHDFAPGKVTPQSDKSVIKPFSLDTKRAIEAGAYISHEVNLGKRLSVNYGLRFSAFYNIGEGTKYIYDDNWTLLSEKQYKKGEIINGYNGLSPRVSVSYNMSEVSSLKAFYNRTYQYLHMVSNSTVGLPTDVWLPADNNIKPRSADQLGLGYFFESRNHNYAFSTEAYYKFLHNVIDYKDNADIFLNKNIETQIRTGKATSYGFEFLFEKKKGKLTGMASYTWSKVEREIKGVNNNKPYAPRYDRRHNASIVLAYEIGKRLQLSANYTYVSGAGITVPQGVYAANIRPYNYYSERNAYKLPSFQQLDINIKYKGINAGRFKSELILGVTNVLNRKNVITMYVDHEQMTNSKVYMMYNFGIMPSITYNFKF